MEDDRLGIVLTKEQWEFIKGELRGAIARAEFHQQGWRETSSPYRKEEAEIRNAQDILDILNDPERMVKL
jgi:hypothetical protein